MKVVIIGAGIAGLTLGVFLQHYPIALSINERASGILSGGHAFLMHSDGIDILKELIGERQVALPGKVVEHFHLKAPDGRNLQELRLGSWQCIKRTELTGFLYGLLQSPVNDEREFSHFLYEGEKVIAAVFTDGDVEYGDVFVGADGGFSKVRTAIFGPVEFKSGRVKEVVGIAHHADIAREQAGVFNKFQQQLFGIAFGMIPTSETELVWFMQYDPSLAEPEAVTPAALNDFCLQQLHDFPPLVKEVLQGNDFNHTYVWNTRDFDLLPSFHKNNVVLMGDAAHLALPFTSAGTTNAMVDAKLLAHLLLRVTAEGYPLGQIEAAFQEYYRLRSVPVLKHLEFGRKLRDVFLDPLAHEGEEVEVPLIG